MAADTAAIAAAVDRRLCHFASDGPPPRAETRFEYVTTAEKAPQRPSGESRPVYDPTAGEVLYFAEQDLLWIDLQGSALAACDCRRGRSHAWIADPDNLWLASRPLLTLPLVEILKRRGVFNVHAAAVAAGGRAIMIAGPSGCGKTTLALVLSTLGLDFLGDDMTFVRLDGPNLQVIAFPDEVDVTEQTLRLVPDLPPTPRDELEPGWPKHRLRVEEAIGATVVDQAQPGIILFPRLARQEASAVEPLSPDEALVELAPNVLLTDAVAAQAHLDALAELVAASRCYRLETGANLSAAARLIRQLVE